MSDHTVSAPLESQSEKPLGFWTSILCLLLGVYLVVVSSAALVGIYDVRANDFQIASCLGFHKPQSPETLSDVRIALQTMFGASLGACLISFLGLFLHAVVKSSFNLRFFGSYLIGPVAVMFLGLAVFILARAGLFAFGNVGDPTKITPSNELSFLGLGILVGFSWNHVLARIAEIGAQVFASTQPTVSTKTGETKPASPPADAPSGTGQSANDLPKS